MKYVGPKLEAPDVLVASVGDGEFFRRVGTGTVGVDGVMFADHGANASFADPNPTGLTIWRGSVAPLNRKVGDLWIQTGAFD